MSHSVTVELSDATYATLEQRAHVAAQSPAAVAAAALEQQFGGAEAPPAGHQLATQAEQQAARERFERHLGSVNLGYATGADNEGIDADLARSYADRHEDG